MPVDRLVTSFCVRAGITAPIIQAPMGRIAGPVLAAAVCNAGGLGMLGLSWSDPEEIRSQIRRVTERTSAPFGVNFVLPWPQQERIRTACDSGARIVSTFWGDPAPYVELIHGAGALHLHTVGSAEEARRSVDAGVDVIVAQGLEAGGHIWGTVSSLVLIPACVDAVAPVPVLAAGGIADGRGLAAALALGADGAVVGTRFLLADEAAIPTEYRTALLAANETDTVLGAIFDGGWPDAKHRVIRNSTVSNWERAGRPSGDRRPGSGEVIAHSPTGEPILRYDDTDVITGVTGAVEALPFYGGQGAALVHEITPAATIIQTMVDDARSALNLKRSGSSRHDS